MTLQKFIHQPTTIAGLASLAGIVEAVLSGHMTWQSAVPVVIGAIVAIAIPDNTTLQHDAEALAADAVKTAIDAHTAAEHPGNDSK